MIRLLFLLIIIFCLCNEPAWASLSLMAMSLESFVILILLGIVCFFAVIILKRKPILIIGAIVYFISLYIMLKMATFDCMFYFFILSSLIYLSLFQAMYKDKEKRHLVYIPLLLIVFSWLCYIYCRDSNFRYETKMDKIYHQQLNESSKTGDN